MKKHLNKNIQVNLIFSQLKPLNKPMNHETNCLNNFVNKPVLSISLISSFSKSGNNLSSEFLGRVIFGVTE